MKMTVIGGGNIGTLMAAEMAVKGCEVSIYSSHPERWSQNIDVYNAADDKILEAVVSNITSDLAEAVCGAEIIWVTYPAHMFYALAQQLKEHIKEGQLIGVVPGSGGAEFAFKELLDRGCTLFGLQRVHCIARLKEYGKSVYMLGRKKELQVGSIPAMAATSISSILETLFDIPCIPLPNYLSVTLTPSNQILHTARLYSMFRDYTPEKNYPKNFLFYEEWTDEASQTLLECDDELQKLCRIVPMDLTAVKSLKIHYESATKEALTAKIRGIEAFKGLTAPMKHTEKGWVPDFTSRYFVADFSYGLKIVKDIAGVFGVKTPNIDEVWKWYLEKTGIRDFFALKYENPEQLVSLYCMETSMESGGSI